MGKRFIISESEKNDIRRMYGLFKEQKVKLPITVTDSYTASNCDELHAFQSTNGKVIGNMNVTVGNKLQEIYNSGLNPQVTNVKVQVKGMTVTWTVTIEESKDGKAWVGFTSRGAGCNQDVINRAVSSTYGNDSKTAKDKIMATYGEQDIEIEIVNDFVYSGLTAGNNSFRQVFYRYTKPKNNPPLRNQNQKTPTTKTNVQDNSIEYDAFAKRIKTKSENASIDINSIEFDFIDKTFDFKPGNRKIKKIILIIGRQTKEATREENFKNTIDNIKKANEELYSFTPLYKQSFCENCLVMSGKNVPVTYQLFIMEEKNTKSNEESGKETILPDFDSQ